MTSYPSLKRWLAAAATLVVLGVAVYVITRKGPATPPVIGAQDKKPNPGDWPMYGGSAERNMVNLVAKGLPSEWDADAKPPVNIKWVVKLGSKSYGGPIIADGRVFVGTNNMNPRDKKYDYIEKDGKPVDLGIVMCFDEAKGDFLWQAIHKKLPGGQVVDWPYEGICSSPYVKDDRVYYVSNRCEVVCADVKTGKEHWIYDMIGEIKVFPHNISACSPLLLKDELYVVTANGVNETHIDVPEPGAPSFIKLNLAGKKPALTWHDNSPTKQMLVIPKGKLDQKEFLKQLVNRGQLIQHGQWSNPAYAVIKGQPQVIFPGGDGWIYAFDPKAKIGDEPIWKFDCNPKDSKYELAATGTRNDFIGTPVIYKDKVYIGVGQDPEHRTGVGHFWCIDMTKKGDVSPELVTDNTVDPPKTKKNPNSAAVWHYGGVIEDEKLQRKLGRNYYFGRTMSTAAIHEDIVYITDLNGVLHCLDARDGKLHWEYRTKSDIWSSPYYADGKVYLGTDNKVLHVFKHGTKFENPIKNDMDGKIRATPIAANGVLYVMTENKLYAIEAKKK